MHLLSNESCLQVGLQTNRSNADESYLQLLANAVNEQRATKNNGQYAYKILDLRPKSSAMANRTQGLVLLF